jgi:hypothetical protein
MKYICSAVVLGTYLVLMSASTHVFAVSSLTNPTEAMNSAHTLYADALAQRVDELLPTITALETYLGNTDLEQSEKDNIASRLAAMKQYLTGTTTGVDGSTTTSATATSVSTSIETTSLVSFLRDANQIANDFTDYAYAAEEQKLPQDIPNMRYALQRMHIDVLSENTRSAESNGYETARDSWNMVKGSVRDAGLVDTVDTAFSNLENAFNTNNARAIYDNGATIISVIPQIETSYSARSPVAQFMLKYGMLIGIGIALIAFLFLYMRRAQPQRVQTHQS